MDSLISAFAWPAPETSGAKTPGVASRGETAAAVASPFPTLRWLGTAGFELSHQGYTVLIDPYISRVSLPTFLFRKLIPDSEKIKKEIPSANAIFVGHSHFDHALDVPLIAARTGAAVYGSTSTAGLLHGARVPASQIHSCVGGEELEVGPFRVRLVPSEHSRIGAGKRVPFPGDIPCSCDLPMRGRDYRCGQVFGIFIEVAGVRLYHAGSANLIDDAIREQDIDLFLMGISGRFATERYVQRVLRRLTPRRIVPTHYDNFFRPLEKPLRLLPRTRFGELTEEVFSFDRQIEIRTLDLGQKVPLTF